MLPIHKEIRPRWDWNKACWIRDTCLARKKSDQGGIEISCVVEKITTLHKKKSDQGGIEMLFSKSVCHALSERNQTKVGLKSWEVQRGLCGGSEKEIRPRWDWNSLGDDTLVGSTEERNQTKVGLKSLLRRGGRRRSEERNQTKVGLKS